MAATVQIISAHGATVTTTETNVTSGTCRLRRSDADTDDLTNPIPKPAAGSNFSWRKSLRIKVTVTPDGDISNLKWFGDAGSFGTGCTLRGHSKPTANYDQASAADESAVISTDGGTTVQDFFGTYTSGSALSMMAGAVILTNPSTGYGTQDLLEIQLEVASTASAGTKPSSSARVLTARFDET